MASHDVMCAIEEASLLIAKLDARISATPLVEPWQVRACFLAAERLARVDGTPARFSDILGRFLETPLPSQEAHWAATVGFAHWRRCMARLDFSEFASQLIGRTLPQKARAAEAQADWDLEDKTPRAARKVPPQNYKTLDDYAREVGERALDVMRRRDVSGSRFWSLAQGMQDAVRQDPDPDYFDRIDRVRRLFERDVEADAVKAIAALPSPYDPVRVAHIRRRSRAFQEGMTWEKRPHLGACYAVLPDRLVEMGITRNRLSCLTGATRRLGFEARLDERAFLGFMRALAEEARAGLALLDDLEGVMAKLATSPHTRFDSRSKLPDVLFGFLLLPAVDPSWLYKSTALEERVVQKIVKKLAEAELIFPWADDADGKSSRETRLWTAVPVGADALRLPASVNRTSAKPARAEIAPKIMFERFVDVNVSIPMSMVFTRFEREIVDIDREFGRFFGAKVEKTRAPRRLVWRDSDPFEGD